MCLISGGQNFEKASRVPSAVLCTPSIIPSSWMIGQEGGRAQPWKEWQRMRRTTWVQDGRGASIVERKESEVAQSSNSLRPHGLWPTRLLHPWDCPGKNTGVGCHFLLQGSFLTQGSNPGPPHCRQTLSCLSPREAAIVTRQWIG